MDWVDLKLWAEGEERLLHECLLIALKRLIANKSCPVSDGELAISGKLRSFLYRAKKELRLAWQLQPEASSFDDEISPKPIGHPDFRFSHDTPNYDQYDYDIECKLVRIKRAGKSHDYCEYYVTNGIRRFQDRVYAQSRPPMGAVIGYVQEGDILSLMHEINMHSKSGSMDELTSREDLHRADVSVLQQNIIRNGDIAGAIEAFVLYHIWADLRLID